MTQRAPTDRAESGTEEEFKRAYSRYKANPDSVRIMIYFKDALIAPSEIEPVQLVAIANFKKQLGEQGTFYWTYKDRDAFESLLRLHLSRQVQSWLRAAAPDGKSTIQAKTPTAIPTPDVHGHLPVLQEEDEGFLDLFERATEHFSRGTEILAKIGNEIQSLGEKMVKRTAEMEVQNKSGNFDFKAVKRINSNVAEDMRYFTARIDADLPYFAEANKIAFDSIARAVALFLDFNTSDTSGLEGMLSTNEALLSSIDGAGNTTKQFRGTIAGLPRVTTDFNKAKRAAVAAIDKLIDEITVVGNMINEVNIVIRDTIGRASKKPSQSGDAL